MKAGDIVFVRGHSLLADAIRRFDPGEFSHCAIAVSDTEIFEAQGDALSHITKMKYDDYEIVSTNLTAIEIGRLNTLCRMLRWKPYDYIQDLGYVLADLFNVNENNFNNPNALICSEAVSLVLYLLGKLDKPMRNIKPNQLYPVLHGLFTAA